MPKEHYARVLGFSRIPILHPAILYDDASGTFNWLDMGTPADYTADYDPSAAYVGINGIQLNTKQTTPAANDYVRIYRHIWLPPHQLLRIQLVFNHVDKDISAYLRVILHWYQGETHYVAGIRTKADDGEVSYASGITGVIATWTVLPGVTIPLMDDVWNKLDLSVNWIDAMYQYIHLNDTIVDGTALPVGSLEYAAAKVLSIYIELETLQAAQAIARLDQILLTPENL